MDAAVDKWSETADAIEMTPPHRSAGFHAEAAALQIVVRHLVYQSRDETFEDALFDANADVPPAYWPASDLLGREDAVCRTSATRRTISHFGERYPDLAGAARVRRPNARNHVTTSTERYACRPCRELPRMRPLAIAAVLALCVLGGGAHAGNYATIPCASVNRTHAAAADNTPQSQPSEMSDLITKGWIVGWADAKGYPDTDYPFAQRVIDKCLEYPDLTLGQAEDRVMHEK